MVISAAIPRLIYPSFGAALEAGGPTTLIYDTFTGIDATNLTAHAIAPTNVPSTSWSAAAGTFTIQSNQAQNNGTSLYVCTPGIANMDVRGTFYWTNQFIAMGLIARYQNTTNWWMSTLYTNELAIYEMTAGVFTKRASTALGIGTHNMIFTLNGTLLTVSVGAVSCNYTSSSHLTETKAGIRNAGGNANIDNFMVLTL